MIYWLSAVPGLVLVALTIVLSILQKKEAALLYDLENSSTLYSRTERNYEKTIFLALCWIMLGLSLAYTPINHTVMARPHLLNIIFVLFVLPYWLDQPNEIPSFEPINS